jgi:hypothetical protein
MERLFAKIPVEQRRWIFLSLLAVTLAAWGVLALLNQSLETDQAPLGIVSLQLAGDVPTSSSVIGSWNETARLYASFSLGFDFLFPPLYAVTLAFACLATVARLRQRHPRAAHLGMLFAWGSILAAMLDLCENVASFIQLVEGPRNPWPQIGWWCSVPKFLLIAAAIVYVLAGMTLWFAGKGRSFAS